MTERSIRFSSSRTLPGHDQSHKRLHGLFGIGFDVRSIRDGELPDEMADQQRNVLTPSPAEGQPNRKNAQPVEEIASKLMLQPRLGQIAVCRRDQPHVHSNRAIASQAFEFLVLKHTQQFGLKLQRNLADFVEEQSSTVRQFHAPDLLAYGSGERAFFVTEQVRSPAVPSESRHNST